MRLITHNMIMCNKEKCTGGYPLRIELSSEDESFKIDSSPANPEFVRKMLTKLDYRALYTTAKSLNLDLPPDYVEEDLQNEHFINAVHMAIFNYHVLEGKLVCPACSHQYKISRGIPDMLHSNTHD